MPYRLRPAGNRIRLAGPTGPPGALEPVPGYRTTFYDSGTAALAAAVTAAVSRCDAEKPEVILPAYGCPDIVSAVLYAGARPVLVDLEPDSPRMAVDEVTGALGPGTVAVIAVNFLGIPERLGVLRELIAGTRAVMIEDSAQWYPEDNGAGLHGDLVILSFGRGKPVSMLGGGAVLARDAALARSLPHVPDRAPDYLNRLAYSAKVRAYNLTIKPQLYSLMSTLPGLHIGETRFSPLNAVGPMPAHIRYHLAENVAEHRNTDMHRQQIIQRRVSELPEGCVLDLPARTCSAKLPRLLRYPVLAGTGALRDRLFTALDKEGLGASTLYPDVLPDIAGLDSVLDGQSPFPNAGQFSRRLLTLPLHDDVRDADIERIFRIMAAVCTERTGG